MTAGSRELLSMALQGRVWVSLHARRPGRDGRPLLAGPVQLPAGSFAHQNGVAANVRDITLDALSGGRAAYVGLWLPSRAFYRAYPLTRPQDVSAGQAIRFRRGTLKVTG